MRRQATQLLAAFCRHETYGLVAMAATLPLNRIGGGTDPAPGAINVYTDVDDKGVAKTLVPPESPAIVVFAETRAVEIGSRRQRQRQPRPMVLAIAYVTDDEADELHAQQQCDLFLRAGILMLDKYNEQAASSGFRDLNGVRVLEVTNVIERSVTVANETSKMWGWLEVHLSVVDSIA